MDFEKARKAALEFRSARDWEQFHNPKDLALSISLEASELLELFQWSGTDVDVTQKHDAMREELADVMIYCIYMAEQLNIDIPTEIAAKIAKNDLRYPIAKARGTSRKYTEL